MIRAGLILVAGIVIFGVGVQQFLSLQARSQATPPPTRAPIRPTPQHKPKHTPTPTPRDHLVAVTVDGLNFTFAPATVTAKVGDSITWVSKTASPHTATSVQPKLFDVSIPGHGAARLVFHRPGTYQYFCALHPYMLGVIQIRR